MRPEKYPRETTVSNLPGTNAESKVDRRKGCVQDSQWKPRLEAVLWTPARALSTTGLTSLPPVTASERWGGEPVLFQDFQSMKRYLRFSQGHRPAEKSQHNSGVPTACQRPGAHLGSCVHALLHSVPAPAP